jgi:TPR repeat protein
MSSLTTLQRLFFATCACCVLCLGTARAEPIDDAIAAQERGDTAQAILLYTNLAAYGNVEAQYSLGRMYYDGEAGYQEALNWFRRSAFKGHDRAQTYLGMMYYLGEGVNKDYREAQKWFLRSANQKNVDAQNWLGVMYTHGKGVAKNHKEALKWYRLAAAQGNLSAQNALQTPEMIESAKLKK